LRGKLEEIKAELAEAQSARDRLSNELRLRDQRLVEVTKERDSLLGELQTCSQQIAETTALFSDHSMRLEHIEAKLAAMRCVHAKALEKNIEIEVDLKTATSALSEPRKQDT
jgi:chromosome segregation ATPase